MDCLQTLRLNKEVWTALHGDSSLLQKPLVRALHHLQVFLLCGLCTVCGSLAYINLKFQQYDISKGEPVWPSGKALG